MWRVDRDDQVMCAGEYNLRRQATCSDIHGAQAERGGE